MTSIPLRQDIPVEDVHRAAIGQPHQIARRFTLIAALLTGMSGSEAAKQFGVNDDYVTRWAHAFNAMGVNGLRRLRLRIPFRNDVSTTDLTITAVQRFIGELHYAIHGPTLAQPAAGELEAGRKLVVRIASAHEWAIECQGFCRKFCLGLSASFGLDTVIQRARELLKGREVVLPELFFPDHVSNFDALQGRRC